MIEDISLDGVMQAPGRPDEAKHKQPDHARPISSSPAGLRQRSSRTAGGAAHLYEIEADDVGPSLRYATARPVKTTRDRPGTA